MSTNISNPELDALPEIRKDEILAKYTTFQVGGPAAYFLETNNPVFIEKAVKIAIKNQIPYSALGGGSNILVSDKGYDGLIIKLNSSACEFIEPDMLMADAGTSLAKVIQMALNYNLIGLEFAVGIPGSFGGAVAGNAGTSGHGIAEFVKKLKYIDKNGVLNSYERNQLDVSYRYTRFKYASDEIIISAVLKLQIGNPAESQALIKSVLEKRSWQPKGAWCAGCIFKNPTDKVAGKLIEEAGLKGKKIGGAKISEEHGNFILNTGHATAEDIVILISYIKQQIRDQFNIQLEEEVRYLGF
ncbi:MAG: UDP-N-acetylmuramate dehydrogenase [Patescibacteria group bacterium]|jgi:UDP-N-acetylmuramate dehydrogenase